MRTGTAIAAAFAFLFLSAGCASLSAPGRKLAAANELYEAGKYGGAAAAFRKIIQEGPGPAAAGARFGLAATLAAGDNPQRNYAQALREFEEFLKLHPGHPKARQARDWRQVLRALEQVNRNIDELKRLDISHEEKRKKQ